MALVKFGAGVSEIRGKEGGVIYSRNAYGAYMKAKVSPVNPQTAKQQAQRALMGNLAQSWQTLTPAEKAAWENLGEQVTRINVFGDSTTYKGFGIYMRLNRNLSVVGESALTVAPSPPEMDPVVLGTFTAAVTGPAFNFGFTPTPLDANTYIVVYATNNIITGRQFVKNYYRLIHSAVSFASATDLYTAWNSYFNNVLIEDATVFVKVKTIDKDTGFDTTPDVAQDIVGA